MKSRAEKQISYQLPCISSRWSRSTEQYLQRSPFPQSNSRAGVTIKRRRTESARTAKTPDTSAAAAIDRICSRRATFRQRETLPAEASNGSPGRSGRNAASRRAAHLRVCALSSGRPSVPRPAPRPHGLLTCSALPGELGQSCSPLTGRGNPASAAPQLPRSPLSDPGSRGDAPGPQAPLSGAPRAISSYSGGRLRAAQAPAGKGPSPHATDAAARSLSPPGCCLLTRSAPLCRPRWARLRSAPRSLVRERV
ncbi:hypothetical protein AAFF_G00081460 [Aldrovandia affinis]|uniref:Uncharacterized protein n=1 Tax=Aldrovandia affinis TaxID=143900 RepID=A0AAD7WZ97_9TELE|nr:hypothetical protein AAFF_G00081460 [Aldrovandia affinis]